MILKDDTQLDVRLQRRDTSPLPDGVWLRFQAINRGKDPSYNYRWQLHEDGRWFNAWHSGDTSDWQTPFDTPLPDQPTAELPATLLHQIREQLLLAQFMTQPPFQQDKTVEDGSYYVVTAQRDGQTHEVIYNAVSPLPVPFLEKIVHQYGY
jgi:hypothetical protein